MKLTPENKATIDGKTYEQLLGHWRYAPAGDPWFEGETGAYWRQWMEELREQPGGHERHVASSKALG